MKKILHITEALAGGVLNIIELLAKSQSENGFDVMILHSNRSNTPDKDTLLTIFPFPIKIKTVHMVTHISFFSDFLSFFSLLKNILIFRPDVIHLHSSKAGVLGRLVSYFAGYKKKVFYSPHGLSFLRKDIPPFKRQLFLYIEKIASFFGGTLVASSQTEFDYLKFYIKHSQIVMIENAIDMSYIYSKKNVGHSVRVVTTGRISYAKAPWKFIDLAKRFRGEKVKFIWIGDGELRNQFFKKKTCANNLIVTGWISRDNVFKILAEADIFVLLSLWEGMPLSLIEAQAAGIPAIVSNVVGNRDVVFNGKTGFVCNSLEDAEEKVRNLINDKNLRNQMGKKAKIIARIRFSKYKMNERYLSLYGLNNKIF